MSSGRVLGLDPGEKRVGVAMSDVMGLIAQPHSVLVRGVDSVLDHIERLVAEFDVTVVVVGLPTSLSGEEGPAARTAREFGNDVAKRLDVPIEFQDERFTSVQAEQALLEANLSRADRKEVRDKVAAAVMLQSYLDRQESGSDDEPT